MALPSFRLCDSTSLELYGFSGNSEIRGKKKFFLRFITNEIRVIMTAYRLSHPRRAARERISTDTVGERREELMKLIYPKMELGIRVISADNLVGHRGAAARECRKSSVKRVWTRSTLTHLPINKNGSEGYFFPACRIVSPDVPQVRKQFVSRIVTLRGCNRVDEQHRLFYIFSNSKKITRQFPG